MCSVLVSVPGLCMELDTVGDFSFSQILICCSGAIVGNYFPLWHQSSRKIIRINLHPQKGLNTLEIKNFSVPWKTELKLFLERERNATQEKPVLADGCT